MHKLISVNSTGSNITMAKDLINILIGGEAGQGLVTIGEILTKSLVRSGYSIVVTQDYQSRIRGGHNTYAIRAGVEEVIASQESVDILVALNTETVALHREELSPQGLVIIDEAFDIADDVFLKVPFKEFGTDKLLNVAALGIVSSLLGLDEALIAKTMNEFFGKIDQEVVAKNLGALAKAFRWVAQQPSSIQKLTRISNPSNRLMMTGNEAIAFGALSAGLKFYSFYPMTSNCSKFDYIIQFYFLFFSLLNNCFCQRMF